uniref:Uncharacterized protein n=1 Tax=Frankliniella occidentalis associated qin-like virus1 TaxID=2771469 RepID=A0A7H1D347_9VIRU|nr:hypothetical protein [Frankliniella occidentalis associated qin-like virus1]
MDALPGAVAPVSGVDPEDDKVPHGYEATDITPGGSNQRLVPVDILSKEELVLFLKGFPANTGCEYTGKTVGRSCYWTYKEGREDMFGFLGHAWSTAKGSKIKDKQFLVEFSQLYRDHWPGLKGAKEFAGLEREYGSRLVMAACDELVYKDKYYLTAAIIIGYLLNIEADSKPKASTSSSSSQKRASDNLSRGGSASSKPVSFPGSPYQSIGKGRSSSRGSSRSSGLSMPGSARKSK